MERETMHEINASADSREMFEPLAMNVVDVKVEKGYAASDTPDVPDTPSTNSTIGLKNWINGTW